MEKYSIAGGNSASGIDIHKHVGRPYGVSRNAMPFWPLSGSPLADAHVDFSVSASRYTIPGNAIVTIF